MSQANCPTTGGRPAPFGGHLAAAGRGSTYPTGAPRAIEPAPRRCMTAALKRWPVLPRRECLTRAAALALLLTQSLGWAQVQPGGASAAEPTSAPDHSRHGAPHTLSPSAIEPEAPAYYTCPMHPSVQAAAPGQCPICAMELVAVYQTELRSGTITVSEGRRQAVGIKTGQVVREQFSMPLRLQGEVAYDPTRLTDISLRFDGWIGHLAADFEGKRVRRGDVLFTVYSPELLALQDEYLQALRGGRDDRGSLLAAARKRLLLWGLDDSQIDWLGRNEQARNYVPIFAPTDGVIIERNAVNGSAFEAGERLLRLADLDQVWVEAYAYERDLAAIEPGMNAWVRPGSAGGQPFAAEVLHANPFINNASRTARVHLRANNAEGQLRPGALVIVELQIDLGEQLLVPEAAVLVSGEKRIVFLDLGNGNLRHREVVTGDSSGGQVVVLEGLAEGERIVTSGTFLIASESKLRAGLDQW